MGSVNLFTLVVVTIVIIIAAVAGVTMLLLNLTHKEKTDG